MYKKKLQITNQTYGNKIKEYEFNRLSFWKFYSVVTYILYYFIQWKHQTLLYNFTCFFLNFIITIYFTPFIFRLELDLKIIIYSGFRMQKCSLRIKLKSLNFHRKYQNFTSKTFNLHFVSSFYLRFPLLLLFYFPPSVSSNDVFLILFSFPLFPERFSFNLYFSFKIRVNYNLFKKNDVKIAKKKSETRKFNHQMDKIKVKLYKFLGNVIVRLKNRKKKKIKQIGHSD